MCHSTHFGSLKATKLTEENPNTTPFQISNRREGKAEMEGDEEQRHHSGEEEDEDEDEESQPVLTPSFPTGRLKRIVKLDREINKVTSEALFLISISTDLFLGFLAERAQKLAVEKKRKTIGLEHIRNAARGHPPTADFLLDCLPASAVLDREKKTKKAKVADEEKRLPPGAQRIDGFFRKSDSGTVDHEIPVGTEAVKLAF